MTGPKSQPESCLADEAQPIKHTETFLHSQMQFPSRTALEHDGEFVFN